MSGKSELRALMRQKRREVPPERRKSVSEALCSKLLARADISSAISSGAAIAVYLATPDELDLGLFISAALDRGARLAAPRWNGETYELASFDSLSSLCPGPHSILEPNASAPLSDASIWLIPGLAFTRNGVRLGYGGGWYDRMLENAARGRTLLGISYGFQVVDSLPAEDHDILMTEIVDFPS